MGKTLVLSDGAVEAEVTLEAGPRIISLKKTGGENVMFQDTQDAVSKDVSAVYGKGKFWHIYGGHRIWIAQEDETTYYPDNLPVAYELFPDGARFTPPAWKERGVQPALEIRLLGDGKIDVTMELMNISKKRKTLSLWALTVLKPGGELVIPLSEKDTGYLANRNLVLWHYTRFDDPRLKIHNDKIVVKSSDKATSPLKLGTLCQPLTAVYTIGGTVFEKRVSSPDGNYPDFSCNVETYTSALIHEVETLSPLTEVKAGGTLTHKESWLIY